MGKVAARRKRGLVTKIIFWIVVVILLLGVGFLVAIPPLVMGDMINQRVDFKTVYDAQEFGLEAKELTLKTVDGLNISAFEVEAEDPKAVIVFISGIHNPSVTAFFGHARMFREYGYASILYDMRAHGKSDGDLIAFGHLETRDTQAVVDYILDQVKYTDLPIIVYGVSMGGAVAINSIGQIPEISGLISMSAYSAWEDVFKENMLASGAPPFLVKLQGPFINLYTVSKFGLKTASLTPKKQITKLGNRPALIMHSLEDSQVAFGNFERLMEKAPAHVETWIRPGDEHMMAMDFLYPENDPEYVEQVLGFLEQNF